MIYHNHVVERELDPFDEDYIRLSTWVVFTYVTIDILVFTYLTAIKLVTYTTSHLGWNSPFSYYLLLTPIWKMNTTLCTGYHDGFLHFRISCSSWNLSLGLYGPFHSSKMILLYYCSLKLHTLNWDMQSHAWSIAAPWMCSNGYLPKGKSIMMLLHSKQGASTKSNLIGEWIRKEAGWSGTMMLSVKARSTSSSHGMVGVVSNVGCCSCWISIRESSSSCCWDGLLAIIFEVNYAILWSFCTRWRSFLISSTYDIVIWIASNSFATKSDLPYVKRFLTNIEWNSMKCNHFLYSSMPIL